MPAASIARVPSGDARPHARERVVAQRAKDEVVLLDLDAGTYFSLDEVGSRVWELCDGARTVTEILAMIVAEYDAPADVIESDVNRLLEELEAEALLVVAN